MQTQHFTKHGMNMNGIGKVRISGHLSSRIMELFTTHRLGTPIVLPWKAETTAEEEKQMRPVVEEFKFTSLELQITDEQRKHSNSVKQDGVKVQNVDFDSANNAKHSCKNSENSTKPPQITPGHIKLIIGKELLKFTTKDLMIFLWT